MRTFDKTGWLPLHQCVNRSEISIEAVQALIELYPQALQCPNSNGQLPLHRALDQANPHIEAVHIMLQAFPGAAKVADDEGYLPLHLALDCARPNPQIAAMLLEHYPEAAFHKSKDGLLPMHCIISAMHPVVEIIQLLLQIFPDSSESMAVDLIPVEETADPETWQGEWIEKRWTPLSRAIDRGLDAIVMLFRDALGNKQPSAGNNQQLPPRTSSAPANRNFMPQSKPPIHNISHITGGNMDQMSNHMNNMSLMQNTTAEMQQPPTMNGMVGPGPSTSSVEGSHHRAQNALVLGGNLDSEDEPNYRVPRDAMLQDSDNDVNIRVANNSTTRMQMSRPVNNSTGNLMANVNGAPPPIRDRAPGGTRNPSINPMMSSTMPTNLADMKAKERERRASSRDGDRDRDRSARRSSSRRSGGERGGERSSERRSSSRHRHGEDRHSERERGGDRDRGRDRERHRYDDDEEYYDEEERNRRRSSSRRRESSRDRSHDRHREHRGGDRESRDRNRDNRERERIYENTEYDDQQEVNLQANLPININATEDSSHLFQQPLANNAAIVNKVRPASSNGGSVSRPSSLLEAASSRPNNIMQQPPGGYNRRGLSAGSARPADEQTSNPNIIRSNQQGSRDLSDQVMLDPNTPANLDEIV